MDRRRIPNLLTMLRLVLAIILFVVLSVAYLPDIAWRIAAAALFVVAAVSDALDGHLARRWNVESRFGRIMDPVVDKVLVLGAFIFLSSPRFHGIIPSTVPIEFDSGMQPWMVVVIVVREMLVTAIRGLMEAGGQSFGAKASGKIKMIVQSLAVPALIILSYEGQTLTCQIIAWTVVIVTLWSGIPYITAIRSTTDA